MHSTRSSILKKERIGRILVLLLVISLSTVLIDIMPANGAIARLNEQAIRALESLGKDSTSSMLSTAINQLNDSEDSSNLGDARFHLEMAENTINDLITALSVKSSNLNLDYSYDEDICLDNPNDCTIADLRLVLDLIRDGGARQAVEVLQQTFNQLQLG